MINIKNNGEFLKRLGVSEEKLDSVPDGVQFTDERPDITQGIVDILRKKHATEQSGHIAPLPKPPEP